MTRVIISGYFNPLHGGHLDLIEAAKKLGDNLTVIINNDRQALLKKGKIILDEQNRGRLVAALADVDTVVLSIDEDPTVVQTLEWIATEYHLDNLIFANGGDRRDMADIPEAAVCAEYDIEMVFGIGGEKSDSSTRINNDVQAT